MEEFERFWLDLLQKELSLEIICGMFVQYTKYIYVMCGEERELKSLK